MANDFFQNRECDYFPCHPCSDLDMFSCMFCYCPLYPLGDKCGGNFKYTEQGIKDCSCCVYPHIQKNHASICQKAMEVIELVKNQRGKDKKERE